MRNFILRSLVLSVLLSCFSFASHAETFVTYYHNDLQGSPVATSDENGAELWRENYKPYGETLTSSNSDNKIGYAGHNADKPTGLIYMQARYYDPIVGRFMGVDPVGFSERNIHSFNRFAYANNNPYKYVDPNGKYADLAIEAISISLGAVSFAQNISEGNYGAAAVDAVGLAIDGTLAIVPVLPGSAGIWIKAARESAEITAKKTGDFVDLTTSARRKHILDGDATGGGHRPGTGKPGKSEFPAGRSDDSIMHDISDIATDPTLKSKLGRGGRTITDGTRNGVDIRVIQERNGDIVTGFPTNVPRNPR